MKSDTSFVPMLVLLLTFAVQVASAYYDPGVQRWVNRDPMEELGGIKLYVFVNNTPSGSIDSFGTIPGPGTITIISDLAACAAIMAQAKNAAENAQAALDNSYACGCNKDGTPMTPSEAMPGNGLGHCLTGYYAKQYGASQACLAAANAGFETWELYLLEWLSPFEWAHDTGRDIGQTFRGYRQDSPEGCLPANCKKK